MKTKQAKVPIEWWERKVKLGKQLNISTPQAIMLDEQISAKVVRKSKNRNGGLKLEIII